MTTAFETWLNQQRSQGLVDIKFAIMPGTEVTVEGVQAELLATEAAIAAGLVGGPPQAASAVPSDIAEAICSVK